MDSFHAAIWDPKKSKRTPTKTAANSAVIKAGLFMQDPFANGTPQARARQCTIPQKFVAVGPKFVYKTQFIVNGDC